jgi:D-arginine dehydrogenase
LASAAALASDRQADPPDHADVLIAGAGIAGSSLAFELADRVSVVLLEGEAQPAYHSTGRSAAMLTETYGSALVRRLTRASRPFFERPPPDFADHPLLSPRGMLHIARADQRAALDQAERAAASLVPALRRLDAAAVRELAPLVSAAYVDGGLLEWDARAIDVALLHQGYLRGLRRRGGRLVTDAAVTAVRAAPGGWEVATTAGSFRAEILVDAAGAWADQVAALAGIESLDLRPLRRTAFTFTPPAHHVVDRWPLVVDARESFYVKPDAGRLLGSPADECPSEPCDARPDETDVALAVERIEAALDLEVRGVRSTWAGLRTFAADRVPVAGPDPGTPSFVWLAGQGGYGIKTSPALAAVTAFHVLGRSWPAALSARTIGPADLSPARLRPVPS